MARTLKLVLFAVLLGYIARKVSNSKRVRELIEDWPKAAEAYRAYSYRKDI